MIFRRSHKPVALASALLVMGLSGCTGSSTPTTSTITGQIDQASFPTAINELTLKSGVVVSSVPVDAAGRFSITVRAGSTYEILAGASDGVPIVVHATTRRLDPTFHVKSGGAKLNLGQVHFRPGTDGLRNLLASLPAANPSPVCADEDDDEDGDQDGHHDEKGGADSHSDGEHSDAGHQRQGASSSESGTEATDCHESESMGLPENNLPDEVGCDEEEHDGE